MIGWHSRDLSARGRSVVEFTAVLNAQGTDYVIMSDSVAILTGRSRATEAVDIVLEPLSESALDGLTTRLEREGYWGMAMPLDSLAEMLSGVIDFHNALYLFLTFEEKFDAARFESYVEELAIEDNYAELSSDEFERSRRRNVQERRVFIKRWAEYVRTHDDEAWSRQQNKLIDSQLQSANEIARLGDTDPVGVAAARDSRRRGATRR